MILLIAHKNPSFSFLIFPPLVLIPLFLFILLILIFRESNLFSFSPYLPFHTFFVSILSSFRSSFFVSLSWSHSFSLCVCLLFSPFLSQCCFHFFNAKMAQQVITIYIVQYMYHIQTFSLVFIFSVRPTLLNMAPLSTNLYNKLSPTASSDCCWH